MHKGMEPVQFELAEQFKHSLWEQVGVNMLLAEHSELLVQATQTLFEQIGVVPLHSELILHCTHFGVLQ
jgi:hypothetical protein